MSGTPAPPAEPSGTGDSNTLLGQTSFSIPVPTSGQFAFDDPAAAAHKRQLEIDDANHARRKELIELQRQSITQVVILAVLLVVVAACLWVMVRPGYPTSTIDKAIGILVAIVSGFVGYFTGQATRR